MKLFEINSCVYYSESVHYYLAIEIYFSIIKPNFS